MDQITIPEAVDELRSQIAEAQQRLESDKLTFEIVEVELQIQGTLTRTVGEDGSANVKFSVLGFGGELGGGVHHASTNSAVQTVKLKMHVGDPSEPGKRVSIRRESRGSF